MTSLIVVSSMPLVCESSSAMVSSYCGASTKQGRLAWSPGAAQAMAPRPCSKVVRVTLPVAPASCMNRTSG
ncbi:MAG TPA: hypothetical protein VF774_04870 [Pseudoduganella sp.]